MKQALLERLEAGRTFREWMDDLDGAELDGVRVTVRAHERAVPYLDHVIEAWVDGPPPSNVLAVLSGRAPDGGSWRRFTISRVGPGVLEVEDYPTPFRDPQAPLSPGIPPAGRVAH